MSFQVGDVVEVVPAPFNRPHGVRLAWVGRQLVVTGFTEGFSTVFSWPHTRVLTSPPGPDTTGGARGSWHPDNLRKINPPDWEAPRVTDKELVE